MLIEFRAVMIESIPEMSVQRTWPRLVAVALFVLLFLGLEALWRAIGWSGLSGLPSFVMAALAAVLIATALGPRVWRRRMVAQAKTGDAEAQYALGWCCAEGYGGGVNDKEAVRWFREAAEKGHAGAQCALGQCYLAGRGLDRSDKRGVAWLRKAVEQGHAPAMAELGKCFEAGRGVDKDEEEAANLFKKSAEMGSREGQCAWARCLAEGGSAKAEEAARWFMESIRSGKPEARRALRDLALRDGKEAVRAGAGKGAVLRVLEEQAAQGGADARRELGVCHFHGWGVPVNKQEAYRLWRLAAEQGDEESQQALASEGQSWRREEE